MDYVAGGAELVVDIGRLQEPLLKERPVYGHVSGQVPKSDISDTHRWNLAEYTYIHKSRMLSHTGGKTMTTTATEDRTKATNGSVDEIPTFKAKVRTGESGTGYAEINITCHYENVGELYSWIIAASNRLVDDIRKEA